MTEIPHFFSRIRSSLAAHALLLMVLPITLILLITAFVIYSYLVAQTESEVNLELLRHTELRSKIESQRFVDVENKHEIFKQELIAHLISKNIPSRKNYEHLGVRLEDGSLRLHPDAFDGTLRADGSISRYISGYINTENKQDPDIERRVIASYHLLDRFGPAWVQGYEKLYVSFPENIHLLYWKRLPWGLMVPPNYQVPILIEPDKDNPKATVHHWSALSYDSAADEWQIVAETPVFAYGKHLMNVGSSIPLNDFMNNLSANNMQGTYNLIIRANGELIAHPEKTQALKANAGAIPVSSIKEDYLQDIYTSLKRAISLNHKQDNFIIDDSENNLILGVSKLAGPDWFFITVYPKSIYQNAAISVAKSIVSISAFLLLSELVILFFVLHYSVALPLKRFVTKTQLIAEDVYSKTTEQQNLLPTNRNDEVGALARSFELMSRYLRHSYETLEQEVADRTQELSLSNKKLEQTTCDLRESSEAKSRFLANMSHEIRTPLTAVIGYANGILDGDIPQKKQKQSLEIIAKNGDHLLHVVNSILDLSKIEAQELKYEHQPTELVTLCQKAIQLVQGIASQKGLHIHTYYNFPLPEIIITDQTRVQQILINIISNAIKFTQQGGISLSLSSTDENLIFNVTDSGIGMSKEQLNHVFQAFSQADDSTSRVYGGTGLGLSISRSLAQGLGGNIDVSSELQKGSCFTISIPLKLPEDPHWLRSKEDIEIKQQDKNNTLKTTLQGHILLAEDNPDNQALISLLLERIGLEVDVANNGKQALQLASNQDFDLILMDIQMPEMDGNQAMQMIKKTGNNTPIIALTANSMEHEVRGYLDDGFDAHIAKPIDKGILTETLSHFLDKRSTSSTQKEPSQAKSSRAESSHEKPSNEESSATKSPPQKMNDILRIFINRIPEYLQGITEAWEQQNIEELQAQSHALKGSAGTFGFPALSQHANSLELMIKNEDTEGLDVTLKALISHAQACIDSPEEHYNGALGKLNTQA